MDLKTHDKICKAISKDADMKWKCDTRELLQLVLDDSNHSSILVAPLRIFQQLLIELGQEIVRVNDPRLNDIALRLTLIEPGDE